MKDVTLNIEERKAITISAIDNELAYRIRQYDREGKMRYKIYNREHEMVIDLLVNNSHMLSLVVPLPYNENGILYIGNTVKRCPGFFVYNSMYFDYLDFMHKVLVDNCNHIFGLSILSTPMGRLAQLHTVQNPSLVVRNIQRMVNQVVSSIPLSDGPLKDYIMNRRLMFLDPNFAVLKPDEKLEYQVRKELDYFPLTGLGLSDSVMSEGNCLLLTDIRNFTPFSAYHNPKRNLFSTGGMTGDEFPIIRTRTEEDTPAKRTGFNFVTAFLDIPRNFEDAIVVNKKYLGRISNEERRYKVFGTVTVSKGETIENGKTLSVERDGSVVSFDEICKDATVLDVVESCINFDGKNVKCHTIVLELHREWRDGYKITNRHGNKGVVVFGDTGVAIDPATGNRIDIDVIVSARSVMKRKNFGQLLEALFNNLTGNKDLVVEDRVEINLEELKNSLMAKGFGPGLTHTVLLNEGKFEAIVGSVFWGFIKTIEDQIWSDEDLDEKKQSGVSRAGVKINPVELRALATTFGKDIGPIFTEILQHAAGTKQVVEQIRILKSSIGEYDKGLTKIDIANIKPVRQDSGAFRESDLDFAGTICDSMKFPKPFLLSLPFTYYSKVNKNGTTQASMSPPYRDNNTVSITETNFIYVPGPEERLPWKHPSGYLGMNELCVRINNIVDYYHRDRKEACWVGNVYGTVNALVESVTQAISTKRGTLSQNLTAIRYRNSAKAVAVQNPYLPKNFIEIHESMANQLGVKDGDVVIVERYPCLGFPSMRLQKIKTTRVDKKKFVIGVSGNSLVSQGLDFDGDVIYILAFKTEAAISVLNKHFESPNKELNDAIEAINSKIEPITKEMGWDAYGVCLFPPPTPEGNAECVRKLAGVKLGTGPIIAVCYDVMRIVESTVQLNDKLNVIIELLLDRVANTVFGQKHGLYSLQDAAIKALCLADSEGLMALFDGTNIRIDFEDMVRISEIIKNEAASIGVTDLEAHYKRHKTEGRSNIIKEIVRKKHKVYFASRSKLSPYFFLENIFDKSMPDDLVSSLVKTRFNQFERGLSE